MRLPLDQSAAVRRRFIDLSPELTLAVIRTVEAGWPIALARPEVTIHADEVTITECLRDAMRDALVRHQFPWRKTMIVPTGTEISLAAGHNRARPSVEERHSAVPDEGIRPVGRARSACCF